MTAKNAGKRVTLAQLADELGIDKSSVSLALRGSSKVSEKTRARVREAAQRHGYRPNLAARRLSGAAPQMVSLLLPASLETFASAVAVSTIQTLANLAAENGLLFNMVSCQSLERSAREGEVYPLLPDGILSWGDVPLHQLTALRDLQRPIVVLDPSNPSYTGYTDPVVEIDNVGGAAAVTRHLLERGAERLLFVQMEGAHLGHDRRWEGARTAWLGQRPLSTLTYCPQQDLSDEGLLDVAQPPGSAIFCSNDVVALEVWHRLNALGRRVPSDTMLAGFDGDASGRLIDLTTAVFDAPALAKAGFSLLTDLLNGTSTTPASIPVQVRLGRTTRDS